MTTPWYRPFDGLPVLVEREGEELTRKKVEGDGVTRGGHEAEGLNSRRFDEDARDASPGPGTTRHNAPDFKGFDGRKQLAPARR